MNCEVILSRFVDHWVSGVSISRTALDEIGGGAILGDVDRDPEVGSGVTAYIGRTL